MQNQNQYRVFFSIYSFYSKLVNTILASTAEVKPSRSQTNYKFCPNSLVLSNLFEVASIYQRGPIRGFTLTLVPKMRAFELPGSYQLDEELI